MESGFKLIFLGFAVLLATSNNVLFSQSDKPLPGYIEINTLGGTKSNPGNSRRLISCPVPENIFNDSGLVVVIVRINKNGRIKKSQIDRIKSNTENKMLFNSALKAANYAKYNPIDKDTVETGQLSFRFKIK